MASSNYHPRIVLQFNEYDFRHRKVMEVLRARPRNMTDLVVNAIMHYISCPDAGDEFGKELIRKTVKEVIAEMIVDGSLPAPSAQSPNSSSSMSKEDADALGDMMAAFR